MNQTQESAPAPGVAKLFASTRVRPERHLVIVHQPGWQAIEDWLEIAEAVVRIDPRIAVFVVSADEANSAAAQQAAALPTLIFAPGPLRRFAPIRGRAYFGHAIPKFEQLRRLAAAGVRVPKTALLQPGMSFSRAEWGPFVIVKPTDLFSSSNGAGISLMRPERVRFIPAGEYPEDHPGRRGPMLVQQFVDSGPYINAYRVLTLFGRPLFCALEHANEPRIDLGKADEAIEASTIATQGIADYSRQYIYEADVVELAAAAYRAIPEAALQGCDIIRDAETRLLYVLELNPGGNTWHFSSDHAREARATQGPALERQRRTHLDAFGSAAHILAERTRTEAA